MTDQTDAGRLAALAALDDLARVELAAVKAWIASGCEGPRPVPEFEEQFKFAEKLSAAFRARSATKVAIAE